jgi:methylglutaconyl-CoA hydratase
MNEIAHTKLDFVKLVEGGEDCLAVLVLDRPKAANAFSLRMMEEITFHMQTIETRDKCRGLIITGSGKHFSAGADLTWMKEAAGLSYADNIRESKKLQNMFEAVANLKIPSVAIVRGASYGGAVGLIAACHFAIAHEDAKFCLSEVKLGILPAVIVPYLARKMSQGQLRRHALTGRVFSALEAKEFGLIEVVAGEASFEAIVRSELSGLLSGAPSAQKTILDLIEQLKKKNFSQSEITVEAIAKARTSPEGQTGLSAFFEKRPTPWTMPIPDTMMAYLKT